MADDKAYLTAVQPVTSVLLAACTPLVTRKCCEPKLSHMVKDLLQELLLFKTFKS